MQKYSEFYRSELRWSCTDCDVCIECEDADCVYRWSQRDFYWNGRWDECCDEPFSDAKGVYEYLIRMLRFSTFIVWLCLNLISKVAEWWEM